MKRTIIAMTLTAAMTLAMAPAAIAGSTDTDQQRKEAAGWGCADAVGLPEGHCISPGTAKKGLAAIGAEGQTFQLLVFDGAGSFLAAEIATFKASAEGRSCRHDPKAAPSYTYWEFVPGLWVCHHQPA